MAAAIDNIMTTIMPFSYGLRTDAEINAAVDKMSRWNAEHRFHAYALILSFRSGIYAAKLLKAFLMKGLLDAEDLEKERTVHFDKIPPWAQKIVKNPNVEVILDLDPAHSGVLIVEPVESQATTTN
jgi:transcriptional regulator of met regulon